MIDTEKPIIIQPSKVVRILGYIAVLLILISNAGQIIKYVGRYNLGFVRLFNIGAEANIPTYYSAVILLIAAFLLNTIATFKKRNGLSYAIHWRILAIIFLYLSMDEMIGIHELANRPIRKFLGTGWFIPYYAWVIPGSALVIVFALSYCRFLLHLPVKARLLFSIAGVLYVGGAVGMELVGGHYDKLYGVKNLTYHMIGTIEETLEMAGVILFIYALLDYISLNIKEIRLRIGSSG